MVTIVTVTETNILNFRVIEEIVIIILWCEIFPCKIIVKAIVLHKIIINSPGCAQQKWMNIKQNTAPLIIIFTLDWLQHNMWPRKAENATSRCRHEYAFIESMHLKNMHGSYFVCDSYYYGFVACFPSAMWLPEAESSSRLQVYIIVYKHLDGQHELRIPDINFMSSWPALVWTSSYDSCDT